MSEMNTATTLQDDPWAASTVQDAAAPVTTPADAVVDDPWAASSVQADGHIAGNGDGAAANTADADTDPWGGSAPAPDTPDTGMDWLSAPAASTPADDGSQGSLSALWHQITTEGLPVQDAINDGLSWVVEHCRPFFQAVRTPIDATLSGVTDGLLAVPMPVMVLLIALLSWQFASRKLAVGSAISLLIVAALGIWSEAMVTLALVLTSLLFCVVIGLPVGIVLASSDRAQRWMRPLLDAMQTTPAFVYLVPVVMLFGIGNVPGVIVTIVFALPPLIRLTNLGIRQVRPDLIEASRAYGASPWQLLWKVQLPLAMPSIMTGINQALMLSLSMVVIASMIAVGGLGQMVLRGIGRLDMGLATVGGLGIVLLAIVLDRLTQAMGETQRGSGRWWHTGPAGLVLRAVRPAPAAAPEAAAPAVPLPPKASAQAAQTAPAA